MNKEECSELFDIIRVYYNFYVPRQTFEDSYYTEFKSLPYQVMLDTVKKHCTNPNNKQPPSLTDIKSELLRYKWIIQSRLIDDKRHPTLTEKMRLNYMTYIDQINKGLKGYGDELESDKEFMEYLNSIAPTPEVTQEELDKADQEVNTILALYDI